MRNKIFYGFGRKIVILIADLIFNNWLAMGLVGSLNKRFKFIVSVFADYPVTDFYADYYSFAFYRKSVLNWTRPILSGLIIFKGKLIIKFSTAKTPTDFIAPENKKEMSDFYEAFEKIKARLNAQEISFAGILPGVLFKLRLLKDRNASIVTANLVCNAIEKIFSENNLPKDFPIIGLGGAGFVGRMIGEEIVKRAYTFLVVDIKEDEGRWPQNLANKPVLLLNLLSDSSGLDKYLKFLGSGSILINEAYPPPEKKFTSAAKEKGIACFHVCGAEAALVIPVFPGYYQGDKKASSIPCCAVPFVLSNHEVKPILQSI